MKILRYILAHPFISLLMAALIGGGFYFLSGRGADNTDYDYYSVSTRDLVQEVSVTGRVEPVDDVDLALEKGGKVDAIYVKIGDKVQVGKVLVHLDNDELLAQLAQEEANIKKTVDDVTAILRANHGITDPEKDDFTVQTQANAMDMVGTITNILTMFVAAVAAISLVVGGVGVMNIMLVSVTERTREIGLRKAIGATEKNILEQFLFEAVILTGTGGLIGIVLGAFMSFVVALVLTRFANLQWDFVFPINAALMGIGVSVFIGLIFGLYPAKKAAKKSPIEALRYE